MSSLDQQLEILSKIKSTEIVGFFDFFEHHDSMAEHSHYEALKDGQYLGYSTEIPLFGTETNNEVKIKILASTQKHIFEVNLHEVSAIDVDPKIFRFPRIKKVKLSTINETHTLKLGSFYNDVSVSIKFKNGSLLMHTLQSPININ